MACCCQRSVSSNMSLLKCKVKQLFRATAACMLEGTFQGSNKTVGFEWIVYAGEDGHLNSLYTSLSQSIVHTNQPPTTRRYGLLCIYGDPRYEVF